MIVIGLERSETLFNFFSFDDRRFDRCRVNVEMVGNLVVLVALVFSLVPQVRAADEQRRLVLRLRAFSLTLADLVFEVFLAVP